MEGTLEPFVHYIPIHHDMSNVEEMINWAEEHPNETRLIAERSTLFVYDLLFHPDAIEDERLIIQGIMETFEYNFGQRSSKKQLDHSITLQSQEGLTRRKRFPTVDERVDYYMGQWKRKKDAISMKRESIEQSLDDLFRLSVSAESPFIASGSELFECTNQSSSHPEHIRRLCRSALPYFDERNTADLKSNSFKRLLKTSKGNSIRFADRSCK
jgi:hypothetical protein